MCVYTLYIYIYIYVAAVHVEVGVVGADDDPAVPVVGVLGRLRRQT